MRNTFSSPYILSTFSNCLCPSPGCLGVAAVVSIEPCKLTPSSDGCVLKAWPRSFQLVVEMACFENVKCINHWFSASAGASAVISASLKSVNRSTYRLRRRRLLPRRPSVRAQSTDPDGTIEEFRGTMVTLKALDERFRSFLENQSYTGTVSI